MAQNIPVVNAPNLYINGMVSAWASNTTLTVTDGICRDSNNILDIQVGTTYPFTVGSTTINAASNGWNGLDTGSLAASTWYALFAISSSANDLPAGYILSASFTAPLLPFDYDSIRLIGYWQTNSSSQFILGYQTGTSNQRKFTYDAPVSVLSSGNATSLTLVDCSTALPLIGNIPTWVNGQFSPASAGNNVLLVPGASTSTSGSRLSGSVASVSQYGLMYVVAQTVSSKPQFKYINSAASCASTLLVQAFDFTV